VPIVPPAPPRLSITTCCPSFSPSRWPTTRAMMSVEPPGGKATISRIGFVGYLSCADTAVALAMQAMATTVFHPRSLHFIRYSSSSMTKSL